MRKTKSGEWWGGRSLKRRSDAGLSLNALSAVLTLVFGCMSAMLFALFSPYWWVPIFYWASSLMFGSVLRTTPRYEQAWSVIVFFIAILVLLRTPDRATPLLLTFSVFFQFTLAIQAWSMGHMMGILRPRSRASRARFGRPARLRSAVTWKTRAKRAYVGFFEDRTTHTHHA
jgi:hypothetical protein